MKCDNCKDLPVYVVDNRGANVQYFCEKHLPLFLRDKSRKPFLTRWSENYAPPVHGLPGLQEEKKAVAKKTAKKKAKAKAVVEEPVVEEVQAVVEDVTVAEEVVVEAVAVVEEVNESDRENSDEAGSSSTL